MRFRQFIYYYLTCGIVVSRLSASKLTCISMIALSLFICHLMTRSNAASKYAMCELRLSFLKFLLKLAPHNENLQNMSQAFHQWWETIDLQFCQQVVAEKAICFQFVYEQSQNFVYRHKLSDFVYQCVLSIRQFSPLLCHTI